RLAQQRQVEGGDVDEVVVGGVAPLGQLVHPPADRLPLAARTGAPDDDGDAQLGHASYRTTPCSGTAAATARLSAASRRTPARRPPAARGPPSLGSAHRRRTRSIARRCPSRRERGSRARQSAVYGRSVAW